MLLLVSVTYIAIYFRLCVMSLLVSVTYIAIYFRLCVMSLFSVALYIAIYFRLCVMSLLGLSYIAIYFRLCVMSLLMSVIYIAIYFRLCVMSLLSVVLYIVIYFIPYGLITVILMAAFGYLLSIDLGSLGCQILAMFSKNKVWPEGTTVQWNMGFLWKWGVKEVVYHICMLVLATGIAGGVNYVVRDDSTIADYAEYLAYGCMGLLAIVVLLSEVQGVYVLFGLWRNKLYPSSAQRITIFQKGKKKLNILGYIRRVIINWGKP